MNAAVGWVKQKQTQTCFTAAKALSADKADATCKVENTLKRSKFETYAAHYSSLQTTAASQMETSAFLILVSTKHQRQLFWCSAWALKEFYKVQRIVGNKEKAAQYLEQSSNSLSWPEC
jgi:hypothetical protein